MVAADVLADVAVVPVEIFALGRFEVRVDGLSLTFERKAPRRPLALLKALVASGGRGVSETRIADALWPDADGDAAAAALATTLHRLRRLLRHAGAVTRQEGLLGLDPRCCRLDTWELERKLAEADAGSPAGGPERLRGVREALALYRGPLLPADTERPWSARLRDALHARVIRVAAEAGRACEAAGRWEDAVACYERALELEPGAEDLYRRLMRGYGRLGRRAEALILYARCRHALAAHVGVPPSPETEALHRTLRAG